MLWTHTSHGLCGLLPASGRDSKAVCFWETWDSSDQWLWLGDSHQFAESFLYSGAAWDFSYTTNLSSFFPPSLPSFSSFPSSFLSLLTLSNKTLFPLRKGSHWTHSPPWLQYKHHPGIEQVVFRICPVLRIDPATHWCLTLKLPMCPHSLLTQL